MSEHRRTRYRDVYKTANGKDCYRFVNQLGKRRARAGTTSVETTEKLRHQAEDRATVLLEGLVDMKQQQEQARAREQVGRVIDEYEQHLLVSKAHNRTHSRTRRRQ